MDTSTQTNGVAKSVLPPTEAAARLRKNKKRSKASRPKAGRLEVMRGRRPPIRDAIQLILARHVLRARDVVDELTRRGWCPITTNLLQYVCVVLNKNPKHFHAIERGIYKLRPGAPPVPAAIGKRFSVSGVVGLQRCSVCSHYGHNAQKHKGSGKHPQAHDWQKFALKAGWLPPKSRTFVVNLAAQPTATDSEIRHIIGRMQDAVRGAVREPITRVTFSAPL